MTAVLNYINYGLATISVIVFVVLLIIKKKSGSGNFIKFCKNVSDFTASVDSINDSNLTQFETVCFASNVPKSVKESWDAFKEARFGYPSEYFDIEKCLIYDDKKVIKISWILFSVLYGLNILLTITGYFVTKKIINCYAFYIIPWFMAIMLANNSKVKAKLAFEQMLEDLDVAVRLQKYKDYQFDTSGLEPVIETIIDVINFEENKPLPPRKPKSQTENSDNNGSNIKEDIFSHSNGFENADNKVSNDIPYTESVTENGFDSGSAVEKNVFDNPTTENTETDNIAFNETETIDYSASDFETAKKPLKKN